MVPKFCFSTDQYNDWVTILQPAGFVSASVVVGGVTIFRLTKQGVTATEFYIQ